jgi:hypothetical protein
VSHFVMQIVSLVSGDQATAFDGQYLEEYDPGRNGHDPHGRPMLAHVKTTPDPHRAMRFKTAGEAMDLWQAVDPRQPTRPDGRPNRPLTAFTITLQRLED